MRNCFLIVAAVFMLVGCSNPEQEKIDALKKETIELHDIVMPRIGEINNLSVELKDLSRSAEGDTTDAGIAKQAKIRKLVKALDDAHNGMMDWMAAYEPAYETGHSAEASIAYFGKEKERISEVKSNMETSINNAEQFLDSEPTKD